jgi:acyl-CoA thioesterase-1
MRQVRNLSLAIGVMTGAVQAETVTIAALGDSLTAGYGLQPADGFVPQMQAWLDAQGADVVLINAGVSGDTTAGGASRVDWTLTPDVDGMIVALGGNDYLRGIDPGVSRANLDKIMAVGQSKGVDMLLIGLIAGSNYGPEFQSEFNGMYVDLAAQYQTPLVDTFFRGLLDAAGTQGRVGEYMQDDGIHPNPEGVRLIVAALGPAVLDLAARAAR